MEVTRYTIWNGRTLSCYIIASLLGSIHGFNVFLSMWTQGQVHVLNAGQSIELDCEFYAEEFSMFNNPVIWKKYQRQEEAEVNIMGNILPPFFDTGRFQVTLTSNPPRYRLKLKILDLALEDSGNYTCEVRGPKSSVMATVTHYIFVRAQVQRIFFSDNTNLHRPNSSHRPSLSLSFIEDAPGQVRCTSIGGYPPPELQVFIGDREITGLFTLFSSATLHGNKGLRLMIYQLERWTDRLSLKAEDDGKQITCVASVSGLATNVSTSAQVSVKYGPIIKCPPSFAYLGEKNAFLQCEVRANPGLTSLFWTIDGNGTTLTEGEIIDEYWTLVVDRSDDVMETQLFMRKTTSSSFRKYTLIAENSITSTRRDVELFQKQRSTTSFPLVELLTRKFNDNNKRYSDAKYNIVVAPSLTSSSTNIASTVTSSIVVAAVLTLFSITCSVFRQLISCHVSSI